MLTKDEEQIFAAQHQRRKVISQSAKAEDERSEHQIPLRLNRSESPLLVLASRKRANGEPYLTEAMVEAGERLRREFERAHLAPKLGIDWQRLGEVTGAVSRNAKQGNQREDVSVHTIAARQRFNRALEFVGEEMSGALVDFCCFLIGLEQIEKKRCWPARSAKQILTLALSRLARHYGLQEQAIGPDRSAMKHWGTRDYKPVIQTG